MGLDEMVIMSGVASTFTGDDGRSFRCLSDEADTSWALALASDDNEMPPLKKEALEWMFGLPDGTPIELVVRVRGGDDGIEN